MEAKDVTLYGRSYEDEGMFSNWLLAKNPHLMITDWKNFYDQLISALQQSTNKKIYTNIK